MKRAKVLVACEESQSVALAFRRMGVEAFSCDILPCSGGYPDWHIQGDVREVLSENHYDAVLAFPPCTHLAVSGARWFAEKRSDGRQQAAIEFFMGFVGCANFVCIENPVSIMSSEWRKPDQYIQPWQFGHGETKKTGLWLEGLPKLEPTNIVEGREPRVWRMPPSVDRAKLRSRTYDGIAAAMAEQWAPLITASAARVAK
jgi:site-specific DNA-cytosine methylase